MVAQINNKSFPNYSAWILKDCLSRYLILVGFCLRLAGAIDMRGIYNARYTDSENGDSSYPPGDFGFDTLNLYQEDGREDAVGRDKAWTLGIIAVAGFALQEFVSKVGVVDETPFFSAVSFMGGFELGVDE